MNTTPNDQFLKDLNDNAGIVHKVCRIYFSDGDDRQDVFQEIVYQLWKSYSSFNGSSKFSTWMYRVALNTAITHVRKSNRTITQEPLYDAVGQIASDFDAPADDERTEMLYAAINTLSSVDKAIVLLYLEENTYEEIASVVGISLQNVSVRLVRIRRKLEEKLRNQIK